MELAIVQWFAALGKGTWLDQFSQMISRMPLLIGIFVGFLVVVFLRYPHKRKQIILACAVGAILFALSNEVFFKHILVDRTGIRPRPYVAHPELIDAIGKQFSDSSFPSSHMASTAMMMTLLVRLIPESRLVGVLFVLLMAFSRMHNGMHYPSDVLAGTLLGFLYAWGGIRAAKKRSKK